MAVVLANNAHTITSDQISGVDTVIPVEDTESFPVLGASEYFYLTLGTTTGIFEIVKVTSVGAASFTVERAQEGTAAVTFAAGTLAELRITAQSLEDLVSDAISSGVSDGDKGDIVVNSSGTVWTIDTGVVEYAMVDTAAVASATEMQAGTASKLLNAANTVTAGNVETVTYAASIALDYTTFINARITLTGNLTLANPTTTGMSGRSGWLELVQDATGNRTVTWGANYRFAGGTDIVLTTTASAVDLIFYAILSDGTVYVSAALDAKN